MRRVGDDELVPRLGVLPVPDGDQFAEVLRREAVELGVLARSMCRFDSGIFSVGMRGLGNIFISFAPVRCSIARA
jgi:hypothetical protein